MAIRRNDGVCDHSYAYQTKMISLEDFEKSTEEKIEGMKAFDNTLSLTEMSKKIYGKDRISI